MSKLVDYLPEAWRALGWKEAVLFAFERRSVRALKESIVNNTTKPDCDEGEDEGTMKKHE
ncbi:uncharacterized protein STEHIDRAFT_123350 [Stereum hirsutum FP-91666 SS1]|uniref:uncharacterized protein n=1 Tax=Stereum hirsutum (strain FP-91666) TaxID=721885 RepID=UPI0004449B47|nr:uncharacterized protein STEHIDRAFT_123350 [Stereum hirsutum FP-91666 SS1]EIM83729.1 hypothetical protein STEHIDRAFT_123350 [Stereum hirsutum FP-91666 SS1]